MTYTVADIPPIGSGEYEEVELRRQTPIFIFGFNFMSPEWTRTKLMIVISLSLQA